MKMLEREIRDIIREELISVLEANPFHDKETGKLSSSKAGNVYSISEPASKMHGNEAKKGVVTASGKTQAKYGLPNECGRKSITGKEIEPKYSCSKFKKKYSDTRNEAREIGTTDITDISVYDDKRACIPLSDLIDIINRHEKLQEQVSNADAELDRRCRSMGYQTFKELLSSIDAAVKAANGEYITVKK